MPLFGNPTSVSVYSCFSLYLSSFWLLFFCTFNMPCNLWILDILHFTFLSTRYFCVSLLFFSFTLGLKLLGKFVSLGLDFKICYLNSVQLG